MKEERQLHTTLDQPAGVKKTSIIGPGLIVAATGVGAGDLVARDQLWFSVPLGDYDWGHFEVRFK